MKAQKPQKTQTRAARGSRKFALSAFLVLSFAAYALEHNGGAQSAPAVARIPTTGTTGTAGTVSTAAPPTAAAAPTDAPTAASTQAPASTPDNAAASAATPAPQATATNAPTATTAPTETTVPTAAPTATSAPAVASNGLKNGTFDGPQVDVQWGLVQVEATVQNGKITNVQFLQYPSDRRTSQRINRQAVPWLQQEALQVQSANVDMITGATLTSEGFAQSLQGALDQARG